jgi:hypothetical protein
MKARMHALVFAFATLYCSSLKGWIVQGAGARARPIGGEGLGLGLGT